MHHHRGGSGGGLPTAPPPPLLSLRTRASGSRPGGRSRSRSRSPTRSKYHGGGSRGGDRDSRDTRDRERDRDRRRSRSPSPYGGSRSDRDRERDRDRDARKPGPSSAASKSAETLPSISLIQSESSLARSIIRGILNPEDVKIPRRVNEGSKPIFDRDELREAMLRRMRANDNEENPPQANAYIQEPSVTQQRVVAIIREPVGADLYLAGKDAAFQHQAMLASQSKAAASSSRLSPEPSRSYRRSPSPSSSRNTRPAGRLQGSPAAPQLSRSSERDRDRDRDRLHLDRERDAIQRPSDRDRDPVGRPGGSKPDSRPRDRSLPERDLIHEIRGAGERDRDRERDRDKSRFGPPLQPHHPLERGVSHRPRSRSPISRVPREDMRLRRRSRSHSVTPPPMPEEIRRQLIEQRSIDLRNALSRRPAKFLIEHGDRGKDRGPPPTRGRGRGGFAGRPGRGREDSRVWVHDMYEGDAEPKKG